MTTYANYFWLSDYQSVLANLDNEIVEKTSNNPIFEENELSKRLNDL